MIRVEKETEGETLPSARTIPEFTTEDEEREWWATATHDTSALPGADVPLRRARSADYLARVLTVPTDQETLSRLKRLSDERGVDYHEVARRWLRERLIQESAAHSAH
jgi:hypothetical protein